MKNAILSLFTMVFILIASTAFGFGSYGSTVNANTSCQPYTGDCTLCHDGGDFGAAHPGKDAYLANPRNYDFFCPPTTDPNDVDNDGDGFTENQGDCNDTDAAVNPDAIDIACDGIDQDCSGSDTVDATCTDTDNDGYSNATDCAPNDASINPGATEICGDGIDQDCSGTDSECAPTEPTCTDMDSDGFAVEGGDCGPIDCNDNDPAVNPAAAERCEDNIDNNCDGLADGQDTVTCPAPPTCTDADVDGFFAEAECNTTQDCDDNDNMIFPGATELCGDALDNDCDGMVDEGCDVVDPGDGATLYENFCASCHGGLDDSDVCDENAREIMEAIAENEGGMSSLSSMTDEQIKAVASTLAECEESDDQDDDDEYKERKDRKERKEHKKRRWNKRWDKDRSDD